MYTPQTREPTHDELEAWRARREATSELVQQCQARGLCYHCEDDRTKGAILGEQQILFEDTKVRAVLAADPRASGHTIVVWKSHVHDFTELDAESTAALFDACRVVACAIQSALAGVERVYLVTMCDGDVNHLHVQLIPRYAHEQIGSRRLVGRRMPPLEADEIADAIRGELTDPFGATFNT